MDTMYDVHDFDINEHFLSVDDTMKIALDLHFNDIIHELIYFQGS
jgi:hypothetical protein